MKISNRKKIPRSQDGNYKIDPNAALGGRLYSFCTESTDSRTSFWAIPLTIVRSSSTRHNRGRILAPD